MAASFFNNAIHIDFDSVLAMDEPGMVSMFQGLVDSGLQGFLGCSAVVYEAALVEFFANGRVRDGLVVSSVDGVSVEISEELFAESFELPVEGLEELSEMPKDAIFDARSLVSMTGEQINLSGKKNQMKMPYRLLCDIVVKAISVKAGSFNAITVEKFSLMTAVVCGVKMNWAKYLFGILKKMFAAKTKQAKGFAIQISALLATFPSVELGEASEFPASKVLTKKTVLRFISINKDGAEEVSGAATKKKICPSASSSPINLSAMASALINNTIQVYFASVLEMEHEGMVSMFEAVLASGLSGFLGCSSSIYEAALVEFFQNASVRDGMVVSTVQGKPIAISEEQFAETFGLPLAGLTDLHEVSQDLVFEARSASHMMALSFDSMNHERFLMMSAIYGGVPVNWGRLLFNTFKDMVTPAMRQARGYVVQICVLLNNASDLELGESKEFPPLKILTAKTVCTYIAKNKNIYVDEDEPAVEKPAEKKKPVSEKRPAPTIDTPVVRKRTTWKATPAATSLALVTVAQEAIPIQMASAVTPPSPRRKVHKRWLQLPAGSDDEIVEKEPAVESVVEKQRENMTADEVDKIIDIVITETTQMEIDMEEPSLARSDDIIVEITVRVDAQLANLWRFLKEPLRSGEDDDMSRFKQPIKIIEPTATEQDKEIEPVATDGLSMAKNVVKMTDSEDTKPLSKVLELTEKSKSDEESMPIEDILEQIPEGMMLPSKGDRYKASLPQIDISDKGKAPLVEQGDIKGHPAREMFSLICADIDFPVQLREKVIADVVSFFHSFSLSKLAVLDPVTDIIVKEKQILAWIEIDSLETAVRMREYIVAKYRDMILRKILSLCWIRTKTLVDGSWVIQEGNDFWKRLPKLVLSLEWQIPAQRQFDDTLARIIGSHNFCRDIVAAGTVVDVAVDPADFVGIFRIGLDVQLILSDSSYSSSSSQPDPISPNDGLSQRHLDTALISPNPSISTKSRMLFTIEDTPLGVDQIMLPSAVTPQYFNEPLEQLRASVNQKQTERVQKRDEAEKLKDVLLLHIRSVEQWFTKISHRGNDSHSKPTCKSSQGSIIKSRQRQLKDGRQRQKLFQKTCKMPIIKRR
ncbi:hypothetical protein F511_19956 [Dorcoceras hygrometricum]|uniref:Dystroglycan-like n=1 Tax=Dorcoceras hygrometricum TaxID=472368 RepID=A0A2Z7AL96_9LAMI|nr:hypothetical protein F511_19956 [Dorcoceras hygrometricum]